MAGEYRVDIKVRNNLILSKIEKAGFTSMPKFCKQFLVDYASLLRVISMTESAFLKDGSWRQCVRQTADALKCQPENLFTEAQLNAQIKTNKRSIQVNEAEMRFMLETGEEQKLLEDSYAEEQRNDSLYKALETLTPREQKVIKMRMGLGEYEITHTLDETAAAIQKSWAKDGIFEPVSRERIRQIEQKALRKLRHPSRSEHLREFIK